MENTTLEKMMEVQSDKIIEPVSAMRQSFDSAYIAELSASIKKDGLINRITVRPVGDRFEIVAGHCRFKAMCLIPLSYIPCVVKEMSDEQVASYRIQENLLRDEVRPVDQALYYQSLIGEDETKIGWLAMQLGKPKQWISDRLNILSYPEYFLEPLNTGDIKIGVAKALAKIEDEVYRKMFFDNAIRDGMTIWQAEYYLHQWECGVLKSGVEIIPVGPGDAPKSQAVIKQECEKCLRMAYAPNLKMVFIHVECPSDVEQK